MRLVLASRNPHKVRELGGLLAPHEVLPLPREVTLPPEEDETFAANAAVKARIAAQATGALSVADDSGIEAAALGGAPGVRSARYAGESASDEENLAKLLREAPAGSALTYVCALAVVDPDSGEERIFEGRCTGRVADRPAGRAASGTTPPSSPTTSTTAAPWPSSAPPEERHRPPGRAAALLRSWLPG